MDGISFTALTKPATAGFAELTKRVEQATLVAVRDAGRETQKIARAAAPVYQAKGAVHIRAVKKARRAGVTLTGEKLRKGQTVESKNQVVAGLLRDSISAGKPQRVGDSVVVRVAPRGPRVHLYAPKEEGRERYMAKAYAAVSAVVRDIHERAWAKVMR